MRRVLAGLALVGLCCLGACAYPSSTIEQGAEAGHLRFAATTPLGTQITVDGQSRREISSADPILLDVPPGKHLVEEALGGRVFLHQEYDVGAGSTINVGTDK